MTQTFKLQKHSVLFNDASQKPEFGGSQANRKAETAGLVEELPCVLIFISLRAAHALEHKLGGIRSSECKEILGGTSFPDSPAWVVGFSSSPDLRGSGGAVSGTEITTSWRSDATASLTHRGGGSTSWWGFHIVVGVPHSGWGYQAPKRPSAQERLQQHATRVRAVRARESKRTSSPHTA